MEATTEQAERLLLEIMWHMSPSFIGSVEEFDKLPYCVKRFVLIDWVNTKDPIKGKGLIPHYNWLKFVEAEEEFEEWAPRVYGCTLNGDPVYRNDW